MKILGGTYLETCTEPELRQLRGSGLRAALSVRELGDSELTTAVDERDRTELASICGALGITVRPLERNEPVSFEYFTPLSSPVINGRLARVEELIEVTGDNVLVFGMVENTRIRVEAERAVFDPQRPRDIAELDMSWLGAEQWALVANASETVALGGAIDVEAAARKLLDDTGAAVVVTKRGARGALVTESSGQTRVPVFPTQRVHPVGSGDVFAAAFAHHWCAGRRDAVDAATRASLGAASYCESRRDDFSLAWEERLEPLGIGPVKVYIAAPFFDIAQRWLVELVRESLQGLGAEVFSPFHDVGHGGDEVAEADLAGLDDCGAVLALLDGDDGGTVFETGYARARGSPVVAYGTRYSREGAKMIRGSGGEVHQDLSTAVYRSIWAAARA